MTTNATMTDPGRALRRAADAARFGGFRRAVQVVSVLIAATFVLSSCRPLGAVLEGEAHAQAAAAARRASAGGIEALLPWIATDADLVVAGDIDEAFDFMVEGLPVRGHEAELADTFRALARAGGIAAFGSRSRLDLLAADAFVVGVWLDEPSTVLVTNASASTRALVDDGAAVPLTAYGGVGSIARRGDVVLVGMGPHFDQALARSATDVGFDPAVAWPEGWASMPDAPVLWMYAAPFDWLMQQAYLGAEMTEVRDVGLRRLGGVIGRDGAARLVVQAVDVDQVESWFGGMVGASLGWFDASVEHASDASRPWAEYVALVARAAYSQVSLVRDDETQLSLSMPAPQCGGTSRQLLSFIGLIGGSASAVIDDRYEPRPWVAIEAPLSASCATEGPGAAQIDLRWLEVADGTGDVGLAMVDLSWLVRALGPDFGGLLTVPLDADAVADALGDAPMGVSLGGADGLFWGISSDGAVVGVPQVVAADLPVVWMTGAEPHPWFGQLLQVDPTFVVGTDLDGPWPEHAALLRGDVPVVALFAGDVLAEAAGDMVPRAFRGPFYEMVAQASLAALTLDSEGRVVTRLVTPVDAASAAADFEQLVATLAMNAGMLGGLDEEARGVLGAQAAGIIQLVSFVPAGEGVVDIVLDVDGAEMFAMMAAPMTVMAANLAGFAWRQSLFEPEWTLQQIASRATSEYDAMAALGTGPAHFPSTIATTPSLEALQAACEAGDAGVDLTDELRNGDWAAFDITTVNDPSYFAYSFESSGVDRAAEFTATAYGDLDCDGTYRVMRVTGHAHNGWGEMEWASTVEDSTVY